MEKIIIGIHGLANKPSEEIQAEGWKKSIAEGLEKNCGLSSATFNFDDVYWADLLYMYPLHNEKNFSFDALYDTEPYMPAEPGALKKYRDSWLDRVRADAQSILGNVVDVAKETFGMDAIADFLIARVLKDLAFYYDANRQVYDRGTQKQQQARIALQERLTNKLLDHKSKDIMLIAHSMGSIIAYDVLRNLGRPDQGVRVSHFVTIGSPLGLPHVKLHVVGERDYDPTVRAPSIVTESWVNFADRKDPVAFDTHLRDDYGPNKLEREVQVRDDLILNDYKSNGKHNHHKVFGYLRAPEMSEHIRSFLGI